MSQSTLTAISVEFNFSMEDKHLGKFLNVVAQFLVKERWVG